MSTLATLLADPGVATFAQAGIIDWFDKKNTEVQGLGKGIGMTIAIGVAIIIPVTRKFTLGSILMGIFIGGLVIWAVNNADFLSGQLEEETQDAPAAMISVVGDVGDISGSGPIV